MNWKTRFGETGFVFQCNCDVLPAEPMAVNLNLNNVPAPESAETLKQLTLIRPAVFVLIAKDQPSLKVPLPANAGFCGVMTA